MSHKPTVAEVRRVLQAQQATKKSRAAAQSADGAAIQAAFQQRLKELVQAFEALK